MYDSQPSIGQYPRLFFTAADLPAIRTKLEHPDCRAAWERLLKGCEALLGSDSDPVSARHLRAEHLAFAYLITGREAFAERAQAMVRPLLAQESWQDRNGRWRAGLNTGMTMRTVGLVYDWLYDCWTPEERATIRQAVRDKAFTPLLDAVRAGDADTAWYTCNGMLVVNGPALMCALLFAGEMDTREVYDTSLCQLRRAIDSHCPDGGYPEGLLYWNYGLRHLLVGIEPLRRLQGVDLYREPFLFNTARYALHGIEPWLTDCVNPSDCSHITKLWPPIAALAAYHRRPEFQWLARRLLRHDWGQDGEGLEYSLFYLLFYDPELPAAPPEDEGRNYLFSGLQELSLRSDWGEEAIHAWWLNGPANRSHNHLHLNSFTVSAFSERLLIECGQYDYSNSRDYRGQSIGHNTLLADGAGQVITTDTSIFCRRLRAGQWGTVYGIFESLREEAGATIATGHTVNAYPGRLRAFDRTLAFVDRQFFFLHDHVELEKEPPMSLTWVFHSGGSIEVEDGHAIFASGDARLLILPLTDLPLSWEVRDDHSERAHPEIAVHYLLWNGLCQEKACDLYALLIPFRAGEKPAAALERCGVTHTTLVYDPAYGIKPQEEVKTTVNGISFTCAGRAWRYDPISRCLRKA